MSIKRKPDENKIVFLAIIGGMFCVLCVIITSAVIRHSSSKDIVSNTEKSTNMSLVNAESSDNLKTSVEDKDVNNNPNEVNSIDLQFSNIRNNKVIDMNKDYFIKEAKDFTKSTKARKKWTFSNTTNRELKFSNSYSKEFKEINTVLYQLVDKYYNPKNFGDVTYKEYIDPLYIMALSNVEFGYATSPKVLLAPAIPTNKGVAVTKENLLTFGIQDYLSYPSILNIDRDGYRGPLQMYVTGLEKGIIPEDLIGSEYTRLMDVPDSKAKSSEMNNLEYVEGSGVSSSLDGMRLENNAGSYGDRFNYGDSVNRLSEYIKDCWALYYKNEAIDKFNEHAIDTKYSFMAMTAIGHNSTPGVYYLGDSKTLSSNFYWWPFYSFGGAREYCHYLGAPDSVNYIKELAYKNLQESDDIESVFKLDRTQGYNIANELVEKGFIPKDLWIRTCWNHEEKIGYPIQVLYNYFILQGIYDGVK